MNEEKPMSDSPEFKMNKTVFSVVPLSDADDEKEYWLSKSPHERLQALEYLRQMLYGYDAATARLQRVFEIAKRERR